jgi:hypothetical protein
MFRYLQRIKKLRIPRKELKIVKKVKTEEGKKWHEPTKKDTI